MEVAAAWQVRRSRSTIPAPGVARLMSCTRGSASADDHVPAAARAQEILIAPRNWADAIDRLAYILGGRDEEPQAAAEEWIRQAVHARWNVYSLYDLTRHERQLAFQRVCGVVLALEDSPDPDIAFRANSREIVAYAFARYFWGAVLAGPPWRQSPHEDFPTYREWRADQDDDSVPTPSADDSTVVQ